LQSPNRQSAYRQRSDGERADGERADGCRSKRARFFRDDAAIAAFRFNVLFHDLDSFRRPAGVRQTDNKPLRSDEEYYEDGGRVGKLERQGEIAHARGFLHLVRDELDWEK
jgi:hypothetical protein